MSEENISLFELLNVSIGTTQRGSINFSALYALLLAVLKQLGVLELKTQWRQLHPGHLEPHASVDVSARDRAPEEEEVLTDTEADRQVQQRREDSSGSEPDGDEALRSRIQTCEDGLSKAMELIKELMEQKEVLKEKLEELHQQQEVKLLRHILTNRKGTSDTQTDVDQCCRRVDALQDAVSSLRETLQKYPDPEELSQRVTWALSESGPPQLRGQQGLYESRLPTAHEQQKAGSTNDLDPVNPVEPTYDPPTGPPPLPTPFPDDHAITPAAPRSPNVSAQEVDDSVSYGSPSQVQDDPQTEGDPVKVPDPIAAHLNLSQKAGGSGWNQEMVRNLNNLQEKLSQVEARMAALEEQNVDQNQLAQLRELISNNKGWWDTGSGLRDQLDQQRALIESLMNDRKKLDSLEDTLKDRGSSSQETSESPESDSRGPHELRQNLQHKLEEDVKQLKSKQALLEDRSTDQNQNLQDQLDGLRDMLEDTRLSLMSQLSISIQDKIEHGESNRQDIRESAVRQNTVLVNDVQKALLKLQAECDKQQETTRNLHEDSLLKQNHIKELFKTTEELDERKADKQMVESEIKADKSALENKVSRLQLDSLTEQLNTMFHDLLNKVTDQEQDWHQVVDRLSKEMECKLNRMELDSVKQQLEDRWKSILEKLQAQSAPEHEDAAAIKKQLVERFHCLSCDRPIVKQIPGPMLVTLPSFPAFPYRKSLKPYSMEQLRQQSRSERFSEPTNYLVVPRSSGGSHTATPMGQRRSGLQQNKLLPQSEADGVSQEFGIIGRDGRVYKGRLNVQAMKHAETKLPTIPSRDCDDEGVFRTKDKTRSSASQRSAASPEAGHNTPVLPLSAKNISRPGSSCSGRDWPVSALDCCVSHSSVSQASAAAGSSSDPQSDDPMNL